MDDAQLAELNATIVAHYESLNGTPRLPVSAEEVAPTHLARFLPTAVTTPADAVITNLHSLCALRTRATIHQERERERKRARAAVKAAKNDADRKAAKKREKQVALLTGDSHSKELMQSLEELGRRLRITRSALPEFRQSLKRRHTAFVGADLGLASGAPQDSALAARFDACCGRFEAQLEFFKQEIEGPVAMDGVGHAGPVDGKALRRVIAEGLGVLKAAGVKSSVRASLFPGSFRGTEDPDERRQQRGREQKAVARAKKRKKSKG